MDTIDTPAGTHGYAANREQLLKRLRRAEGQVRGVARMVEEDRYCIDVLTQISALQAAIDKVALAVLHDHVAHCMAQASEEDRTARVDELMGAVGRLVR